MTALDEVLTKGHIASALLFIAVALSYYVFVIRDRKHGQKKNR